MKLRRGSSPDREPAAPEGELAPRDPLSLRGDFDRDTLPWIDAVMTSVDDYVQSLGETATTDDELRERLLNWMQFGYAVLPGAVEHRLIDAYLEDVAELFERREG